MNKEPRVTLSSKGTYAVPVLAIESGFGIFT